MTTTNRKNTAGKRLVIAMLRVEDELILLPDIRRDIVKNTKIPMQHMTEEEVNALMVDLLQHSSDETKSVSAIAYHQTKGNLFFWRQFLSVLQCEHLL